MANVRISFGRYELGGKDGDASLLAHMQKLETHAENATEAFRALIHRDLEVSKKEVKQ